MSAVAPTRLSVRDALAEAVAGMLRRPGRAVLTALGTVLGVGSFVAVLGLTATISSQIDARFNVLTATEVSIEDVAAQQDEFAGAAFPADAEQRLRAVAGIEHAGVLWTVRLDAHTAVGPLPSGAGDPTTGAAVVAASPAPSPPSCRPSSRAGSTTTSPSAATSASSSSAADSPPASASPPWPPGPPSTSARSPSPWRASSRTSGAGPNT